MTTPTNFQILKKKDILQSLRQHYPTMAREYGISRIGLFGSYARDTATPESDIDIFVEFNAPIGFRFIDLAEQLEKMFGKTVDLLTPAGIKTIRNKAIAEQIQMSIEYVETNR